MAVELTPAIAARVLDAVLSAVETPGIICGPGGLILAAAAKERIGSIHEGSARILRGEFDEIAITEEDARAMENVRPGFNCVVTHQGRRIGTIGIQGNPVHVKGTARIAARAVQLEMDGLMQKEQIRQELLQALQSVTAAAEQVLAGTEQHQQLAGELEGATVQLRDRSQSTNAALNLIHNLSQRATLLSLNAAIEAAHAGQHGAGFAVVAGEVRRLAEQTKNSAADVQVALNQWRSAFDQMAGHVAESVRVSSEQAEAIRSVTLEIQRIEAAVAELAK